MRLIWRFVGVFIILACALLGARLLGYRVVEDSRIVGEWTLERATRAGGQAQERASAAQLVLLFREDGTCLRSMLSGNVTRTYQGTYRLDGDRIIIKGTEMEEAWSVKFENGKMILTEGHAVMVFTRVDSGKK